MLPSDGATRVHPGGVHRQALSHSGVGSTYNQQACLAAGEGTGVSPRELWCPPRKHHGKF